MYLQNLRVDFLRARSKKDFAEVIFTSIAVGFVVLPEALVGMYTPILIRVRAKPLNDYRNVLDEHPDTT